MLTGSWTPWPQIFPSPAVHTPSSLLSADVESKQQVLFATKMWRGIPQCKSISVLFCVWFFFFFKLASEVLKATSWNCHFHLWCLALNEAFVAYFFQVHNTQPLFHTFVPARRFPLASSPLPCFLSLLFFSSLQPHCVWKLLKSWMVRAKMKSSCLYIIIFSFYLF